MPINVGTHLLHCQQHTNTDNGSERGEVALLPPMPCCYAVHITMGPNNLSWNSKMIL